jgi:hypothetical protein
VKALFFGSAGRARYGVVHPSAGTPLVLGAVICHPLPFEYARLRWIHRSLAELLAARGLQTLRFDLTGAGDSSGDLGDATAAAWTEDLGAAVAEARESLGALRVVVVGQGLAAAAVLHAASQGLEADALLLIDPALPVVPHLEWLQRHDRHAHPGELLGQPFGPSVQAALRSLEPGPEPVRCKGKVLLLETRARPEVAALAARLKAAGLAVEHRQAPEAVDRYPEALDEALLSTALPEAAARFLTEALS